MIIGVTCNWIPTTQQYCNTVLSDRMEIQWVSPSPMAWLPIYHTENEFDGDLDF